MLCESVCHQLWSWEKVLFSSVSFVRLYFSDTAIFFTADFGIKNSASNFVLIFRKLLRKPTVCYRKPSEIMPWAKVTFIMVQTLQGQTNVCRRRRWAFWTNVDKHNTGKHSKLSVGYPCRSWENYPRYLWDSRTVIRDRSTHCVGQFEHETQFCVICAKTAERRPENPSLFCLKENQITSQRRPQLHLQYHNRWLNMGVWLWLLRLSSSRRSGSRQIHRDRKKRVNFAAMSSPFWSVFIRHPRHCPQGIRTPWSHRQC